MSCAGLAKLVLLSFPELSPEFFRGRSKQVVNRFRTTIFDRAEKFSRPAGSVQPNGFSLDNVYGIPRPCGSMTLAQLRQPEIGMCVVCRSWIKVQIKLISYIFPLKLPVASLDSRF